MAEKINIAPKTCKNHHPMIAKWLCEYCHNYFCSKCIRSESYSAGMSLEICKECGGKCNRFLAEVSSKSELTFLEQLREAFQYPFQGLRGPGFITIGALIFWAIDVLPFIIAGNPVIGGLVGICLIGFVSAYFFEIIFTTGKGQNEPPEWTSFNNFWSDLLQPFLLFIGVTILCFSPAVIYAVIQWLRYSESQVESNIYYGFLNLSNSPVWLLIYNSFTFWFLVALGSQYFLISCLSVSMYRKLTQANPVTIFKALKVIPKTYFSIYFLLLVVLPVWYIIRQILLLFPPIGWFIERVIFFYGFIMLARLLGLQYLLYQDKLKWELY